MQAFFRGISFRLAKVGVVLAFVLGFAMSSLQLYLDLDGQQQELDTLVQTVIEVATPPAARAVHTLDNDLSQEVVNGLLSYDFVFRVKIADELGNVLAEGEREREATPTRWLTRWITEDPTPRELQKMLKGKRVSFHNIYMDDQSVRSHINNISDINTS